MLHIQHGKLESLPKTFYYLPPHLWSPIPRTLLKIIFSTLQQKVTEGISAEGRRFDCSLIKLQTLCIVLKLEFPEMFGKGRQELGWIYTVIKTDND